MGLANGETLDGPDAPLPTKTVVYKTDIVALTGVNHAVLRDTHAGNKVNSDGSVNSRPDMVCMYYLAWSCFQGDACTMRHLMDPEEIARKRAFFRTQLCHAGAACQNTGCLYFHPGQEDGQPWVPGGGPPMYQPM